MTQDTSTPTLVDELEWLAANCSPGPWHLHDTAIGVNPWVSASNGTKADDAYARGGCILNMVAHDERKQDATLIVALHNNLPAILSALRTKEAPADVAGLVGELEQWADIQDDPDAIIACGERWKAVAAIVGCTLHGFNDGRSASFVTPDGSVIAVGPKLRALITHLSAEIAGARKVIEVAAPMLVLYAAAVARVPADDLELHPYQPAIEDAADAARTWLSQQEGKS